jgi:hypothetical protein
MTRLALFLWCLVMGQIFSPAQEMPSTKNAPLEQSAYFAYVGYDYIFTIEIVKPGVPLFNFVSMMDQEVKLPAKNVRLSLPNRNAPARLFAVEPGDFQQPLALIALTMRPRSSFGVRLEGDFADVTELNGAVVRIENEDFHLVPLTKFDFESLVLKVNRLNLGSPDFREDWRVLHLEAMGSHNRARR